MAERDMSGELRNELARQAAKERQDRMRERAQERAARAAEHHANHPSPFESQAVRADFRSMIGVATIEATNRASASIEAEHLLLAFLFDRKNAATELLAQHGLTYETFSDALQREREQTLAAIGITIPDPERLRAAPRVRMGGPRFGASAKEVWDRVGKRVRARRGRAQRYLNADFLHSLLSLELGTVPRALTRGGFDRAALLVAIDELAPTTATTTKESK